MDLVAALREQQEAWESRPLLRMLYRDWFARVAEQLANVEGPTVELGAGIAKLREIVPYVVATDIEPTPWSDAVADAEALPFENASVANLVLIDVYHHLPRPTRFLDEATRVLRPGGRVVVLDPYCSPLSTPLYRRFHHERTDLGAKPFADDASVAGDPMASNQARATLEFFRHARLLERRWPALRMHERKRIALLAYPLSGGFSKRPRVPDGVLATLLRVERLLQPLAPLLAFRCLVTLERV